MRLALALCLLPSLAMAESYPSLHAVIGRRLFGTWEITQGLLENRDNGIQDAIYEHILGNGEAVFDMAEWDRDRFEQVMAQHPKPILKWS